MNAGLKHYYPEMGEPRPESQIEASMGHYGRHWYIHTPLALKGRGIEFISIDTDERRKGWFYYKVTLAAFKKLSQQYAISSELHL